MTFTRMINKKILNERKFCDYKFLKLNEIVETM